MAFSLRALAFVTLVCCLSTQGTFVETTHHWKPPPPLLASQCDIAHLYRDAVPAAGTNVTSVFSLGGEMDLQECIFECCKVGPRQCRYAFLLKDLCFAIACAPGESRKCMPVTAADEWRGEVTYVKMSYSAHGNDLAPIGLDHPPTAVIDPHVGWVSSSEAYLYGSHSSDDKGISSYHWRLFPYWRGITLEGTNTDTLHMSGLLEGKYRVSLTVTDLAGQSDRTDINFTVSSDLSTGESDAFHDLASELLLGGEDSPSHTPSQEASTAPSSSTATSVSPTLTLSDQTGQTSDPALEEPGETRTEQSTQFEKAGQSGRTNGSELANETGQSSPADHDVIDSTSPADHDVIDSTSPADHDVIDSTSPADHDVIDSTSPADHDVSDSTQSSPDHDEHEFFNQSTETSHSNATDHDQPAELNTSSQPDVISQDKNSASGSNGKSKPNIFAIVAVSVLLLVGLVLISSAVVVSIPACCVLKREAKRVKQKYRRVPIGISDA